MANETFAWEFVERIGDHRYWRRFTIRNGELRQLPRIYNCTNSDTPPGDTDGGYPNLNSLKKLKGDL